MVEVCLLDGVHQGPLVVGLEEGDGRAQPVRLRPDQRLQVLIGLMAVDLRLADSQHVHIGAVNYQNVHKNPSR